MESLLYYFHRLIKFLDEISVSIFISFVATFLVLGARILFYRVRDRFPAGSLFNSIAHVNATCLVFMLRMTDVCERSVFKTFNGSRWIYRKKTPWVVSTYETQALALIFNALGRVGRTRNIEVVYADKDHDRWDNPMFILGASPKAERALANTEPYFTYVNDTFKLLPENIVFKRVPSSYSKDPSAIDIGLLQKMINLSTEKPIWLMLGHRGEGTTAAAYSLVKWWRELGILYGKKPFGLLVKYNDKDGWQQLSIIKLYPEPNRYTRLWHWYSWLKLKQFIDTAGIQEERQTNEDRCTPPINNGENISCMDGTNVTEVTDITTDYQ